MVSAGIPTIDGGVPIPVEDFAYDGEGNRLSSHLSSLYLSDDHNRLTEDSDYTYTYDDRGNRISRTAKVGGVVESYGYNSVNKLVAYDSGTGTVAAYFYDALGRRIAKQVDGITTAYIYDPWNPYSSVANDILLEFEDGTLTRRWQHGAKVDEPLAFEGYAGSTTAGTGSEFALYADRQGTILAVVDPITGTLAAEYTYDAFGQITQTGALHQPFGFTGREFDAESGLYYYRARYYDPALGMFIQSDPIGFAAGDLNIYAYVGNDPFNWSDPSGLTGSVECMAGARSGGACGSLATGVIPVIQGAVVSLAGLIVDQILNSIGSSDDGIPTNPTDTGPGTGDPQCDPDEGNDNTDLTSEQRRRHILDGDRTGGGHRPGLGKPGKSEFPTGWSDDKIIGIISDIVTAPDTIWNPAGGGRSVGVAMREGVEIRVVTDSNGDVVTGYPTNTPRNPPC